MHGEAVAAVVQRLAQGDGQRRAAVVADVRGVHGLPVDMVVVGIGQALIAKHRVEGDAQFSRADQFCADDAQRQCRLFASGIAAHLGSCQQEGAHSEVGSLAGADVGAWCGVGTDGLHVAHRSVLLQCHTCQVVPSSLQRLSVAFLVEDAVVDAPCVGEHVECRAAGLIARRIVLVEQRTAPVAVALVVGALAQTQALGHAAVVADVFVAVRIVGRQLVQHACEGREDPTVAAGPEVLAAR